MATQKKPGKALVNWEEKFAGLAKDSMKGIDLPTAKWLSIKSGVLTYGGAEVPDNELRCIIVGYTYENQFYVGRFDANNPSSPVCYAFGLDSKHKDMEISDAVTDQQSDACATCPHNEFESDPNGGKGKACKNVLRLALIAESDLEDLDAAEVVYLKVPTTSVKNFNYFAVKTLKTGLKRPLWSVMINLSVEPDDSNAVKVNFDFVEKIEENEYFNDDSFEKLEAMWDTTMESIGFPYPENVERPQRAAPKRGVGKQVKGKAAPAKPAKFNRK